MDSTVDLIYAVNTFVGWLTTCNLKSQVLVKLCLNKQTELKATRLDLWINGFHRFFGVNIKLCSLSERIKRISLNYRRLKYWATVGHINEKKVNLKHTNWRLMSHSMPTHLGPSMRSWTLLKKIMQKNLLPKL